MVPLGNYARQDCFGFQNFSGFRIFCIHVKFVHETAFYGVEILYLGCVNAKTPLNFRVFQILGLVIFNLYLFLFFSLSFS